MEVVHLEDCKIDFPSLLQRYQPEPSPNQPLSTFYGAPETQDPIPMNSIFIQQSPNVKGKIATVGKVGYQYES